MLHCDVGKSLQQNDVCLVHDFGDCDSATVTFLAVTATKKKKNTTMSVHLFQEHDYGRKRCSDSRYCTFRRALTDRESRSGDLGREAAGTSHRLTGINTQNRGMTL
jgi:hypothetical protein